MWTSFYTFLYTISLNVFFPSFSPFSASLYLPNAQHLFQKEPREYSWRTGSSLATSVLRTPGTAEPREQRGCQSPRLVQFPGKTPQFRAPSVLPTEQCGAKSNVHSQQPLMAILFGMFACVYFLLVIIHLKCSVGDFDKMHSFPRR